MREICCLGTHSGSFPPEEHVKSICCLKGIHSPHVPLKPNETKTWASFCCCSAGTVGWLRHKGGKLAKAFLLLSTAFKINLQANVWSHLNKCPVIFSRTVKLFLFLFPRLLNVSSLAAFLWNKQNQFEGGGQEPVITSDFHYYFSFLC